MKSLFLVSLFAAVYAAPAAPAVVNPAVLIRTKNAAPAVVPAVHTAAVKSVVEQPATVAVNHDVNPAVLTRTKK